MSGTKFICTYFDYNFLSRGLALYHSIERYHDDFVFYALVFDSESFEYLSNLKKKNLIPISFETYNDYFNTRKEKYEDAKQYYFSATPNLCIYLIEKYPEIDILLYLDADVYAFGCLDTLYLEFGNSAIGYCPHRLHPIVKYLSKDHGKYNVGVNLFRNSVEAKQCLYNWKNDCDSWYKGKPGYKLEYFSDQIFLNEWEKRYNNVKIIQNIGVDVAPWNAANYKFTKKDNTYYVNDKPIIIYHFSSIKRISKNQWNCNSIIYYANINGVLGDIYKEYIRKIQGYKINTNAFAEIKLSKNVGKRIFYSLMSIFLNEVIIEKE
ncbi:MAG: hypothetical protein AB9846_10670 [Tenuifilaceae bacterium]